jgi:urease accessory protein
MIIEKIIGNIDDPDYQKSGKHQEKIYLDNQDLAKRLHRVISDHGHEFLIKLPTGQQLHVGDILVETADNEVIIAVNREDVLVIKPKGIQDMGKLAHALGNRHLPAQFIDDKMIVQYDYLVEELLTKMGLEFERESLEMVVPFQHVDHKHV